MDACANGLQSNCRHIELGNTGVSERRKSLPGSSATSEAHMSLDTRNTLKSDAEQAGRAIYRGTMARRGFQQGSLFQRGTRRKVWVARWWEDVIQADGTLSRLRRSQVIGTIPTRRLAMQALSQRQLRELTREELQSFLSRKLKGGLSWETVHHFKCGLSKILGAAEEWGYIAENAAQKTKLPRRQHGTERTVLTPVHVRNLATALNEPARSITLLLVLTGLRVGELLALRWGSIDLKARLLRVAETVYDGHFDRPKTKRSARTIPIGTETAEILAAIHPAAVDARALVFASRDGLARSMESLA